MPRWTLEQIKEHPKRDSLLGAVNTNIQKTSSTICKQNALSAPPLPGEGFYQFTVDGEPMGKPRQTQRDKWQKRPCVLRYREYCDRIRATAKLHPDWDCYAVEVAAHVSMPDSWSKKKRTALAGQLMRSKPDWDNIGKAVCDALFKEDSMLAGGTVWKFWTDASPRTEITVLYYTKAYE